MNNQNNSESHIKILTNVCENVCTFITKITEDSKSKDEKINNFQTKVDGLQCTCSELKTQIHQINENVKTLARLLNFTFKQGDSTIDILTQWILSVPKTNNGNIKKRKICSSYSPLKLSLKDRTEVNENMENKLKYTTFEKEKTVSQSKLKNVWKLQIKRDGNPSDLIKKSKQTTLKLKSQEQKMKMDITTINSSTPKISVINSNNISSEVISVNQNDISTHFDNNLIDRTQIDDSNISLSNFNNIKVNKNILPIVKPIISKSIKANISHHQNEKNNQSCNETICSPIKLSISVLNNAAMSKEQNEINNTNLFDSFDIIPGLNDKQNDLPDYNFKEEPVRKHNERKLLNGWDCKDCYKFYKANNDNPIDRKTAMNHFSRHRSIKQQNCALTPEGFWDLI